MQKLLYNLIIVFLFTSVMSSSGIALATDYHLDKTKVVAEQIDLLRNRLTQAQIENKILDNQQDNENENVSLDHISKEWLNWTKLDIDEAQSNLDSINIELAESLQTINLLQKDTQEIENQLNVYNILGVKLSKGVPNLKNLTTQLQYQKGLLSLEKTRSEYLSKLQGLADDTLQSYNTKYSRIETLLKSQTMLQLKEQQAKYEVDFQDQQNMWLQRLKKLYAELAQFNHSSSDNQLAYLKLQNNIFYVNENVNFMYLKMLIMRYQDQIQQLKISISHSSSITLLNKVSEQTEVLSKQFSHISILLATRMDTLKKRKTFYSDQKFENATEIAELDDLQNQYKDAVNNVASLSNELATFRDVLNQDLQQELSARQGLLGFGSKAWLDLGNEMIIVPTLGLQMVKRLTEEVFARITNASVTKLLLFALIEMIWIGFFYCFNRFLKRWTIKIPDHALGLISLKWLTVKVLHNNLLDMAIIGNMMWFFALSHIPSQTYHFLINISLVWLFFRILFMIARVCLVENAHDRAGQDVRLYRRLKWTFWLGGVIMMLTVFIHQLPLIYEVKDLFYRLFLLFLGVSSLFLLKSWDVVPAIILPHIDERRTYFRRIIRILGLLIPLILLVNSIIGLFGFLNFVLTVSWYESVFLLVMVGYLLVRGVLREFMEFSSRLLIRHVANGWLWTEAFLKPLDTILRIGLFFTAWFVLFFFYQWGQQSVVVESLTYLLHYTIFNMLDTSFTLISIIEVIIIGSLLCWAARWTREFMYRFLLSRTKDLGLRNSIAILSQYTMILIGILIGLRVLGIDLRALTFVASAFALGVGLGLRDLVNNFACGFLLLLERPLRVGDTISINGHEGDVMHIGGRAVTIRTWDHMEVLVPNAEIFSKTFVNWTAKDYVVRSVVLLKIHRHDNPHEVQALIYDTLKTIKKVLTEPRPEVFLKELAGELIEFEVRYYINLRQTHSRSEMRSEVLMAIWTVFEEQGIKPPYPHHEVHIRSENNSHPVLPLLTPPVQTS